MSAAALEFAIRNQQDDDYDDEDDYWEQPGLYGTSKGKGGSGGKKKASRDTRHSGSPARTPQRELAE